MGIKTALSVVLVVGTAAAAHPFDISKKPSSARGLTPPSAPTPEAANFSDNFDSYAAGSSIVGQGGWQLWYSGGFDATVVNTFSNSAPNSLSVAPSGDVVQVFNIAGGKWSGGAHVYVDPGSLGDGYFIVMNGYGSAATNNWSVQVRFGASDGLVESQFGGQTTPLAIGQWKALQFDVNLDQVGNNLSISYDGTTFASGLDWQNNVSGAGNLAIACFDLFNLNMFNAIYFDDVFLKGACYADCEQDGDLDVFDYLCFLGLYANQDPYADCEGDGDWDVFDFLCFQGAYSQGC